MITPASWSGTSPSRRPWSASLGLVFALGFFLGSLLIASGIPAEAQSGAPASIDAWGGAQLSGTVAGDPASLRVIVRDANGNAVSGVEVRWTLVNGGGSFASATTTTGTNGIATGVLATGRTVGWNNATASATSISGASVAFSVRTVAGAASTTGTTITVSPGTLPADSASTSRVTVRLRDTNGNPVNVSSGTVTLHTNIGTLSDVADLANGSYISTLTASNRSGTATLTGTLAGQTLSRSATLTFQPLDPAKVAPVGSKKLTPAAGSTPSLRVLASDVNGNPVLGVHVAWTLTGSGSISNATSVSGTDGIGATTLTTTAKPASFTVTATSPGLAGSPITFQVDTVIGPPASLSVQGPASVQHVPAGAQMALIVRVRDAPGNPVQNAKVVWTVKTGNGSFLANTTLTDATGNASATLKTSKTPGTTTITAANGSLAPLTISIGTDPWYTMSQLGTSPTNVHAGNDTSIKVHVVDQNGIATSGVRVNWAVASGGGTLSSGSSLTGSDGNAATTVTTGSKAGSNSVTATNQSLTGSPITVTLVTVAGDPSTVRFRSLPSTVLTNASVSANVDILDEYGNVAPRTGQVTLSLGAGPTGHLEGTLTANAAAGVAAFNDLRFNAPGTYRLVATYKGIQNGSMPIVVSPPPVPSLSTAPVETLFPVTEVPADLVPFFVDYINAERLPNGSVLVNWTAPEWAANESVDGFLIWRASSPFALLAQVDGENDSFLDASADGGHAYRYAVTLFLTSGEGLAGAKAVLSGLPLDVGLPSSAEVGETAHPSSLMERVGTPPLWLAAIAFGLAVLAAIVFVVRRYFLRGRASASSVPPGEQPPVPETGNEAAP